MSHHTLLHRAVRPLVSGLARTGVPPDAVTSLRLLSGLGAAGCMLAGQGPIMAIGAGLFLLSMLLDRIDGALARATARFSRIGPVFDLVSDCVSTMTLFMGLGIGIGALPGGISTLTGLLIGLLAACSIAITFAALNQHEPAAGVVRPVDPDDAMLAVPLVIWSGHAPVLLLLAAILSPIAAVVSVLLAVQQRRRPVYAESRPSRSVSTS